MNNRMNNIMDDFKDEIDWGVYKSQNNVPANQSTQKKTQQPMQQTESEDVPIGGNKRPGEMVNTFMGKMPHISMSQFLGHENVQEAIREGAGATGGFGALKVGIPLAGKGVELAKQGLEYINPEKISQELMGKIGQGTVSENIGELGKRIQLGKQSAQSEALIPKQEFMQEAQGKNITRLNPEKVSLNEVAKIFEDDVREFTPDKMKALQKAINGYYKNPDIDSLAEKGADIFDVAELSPGNLSKLESLLPFEKLNKGAYLTTEDVGKYYAPKGELAKAHAKFAKTRSVEDADKLMSGLKDEIRDLKATKEKVGLGDVADAKLQSYEQNLKNLKSDWGKFVKTLPEGERGKYQDFLRKYAINVGPYENVGSAIRQMAAGNTTGIQPETIESIFSNPNPKKDVLKIINDIGPGGWNNIVYNMLMKYKPGDVKNMASAILEGARKGSPIITDEMVKAANVALKRGKISSLVKASAGGIAGGAIGGPLGAAIGAVSPYLLANKDVISKLVGKIKR